MGSVRMIAVGELQFRVLDEGEGPPALLLHGFPDRAEEWRYVGAELRRAGRRTLALDLHGFGESSAPASLGAYRVGRVIADLDDLLAAVGISGAVDVIGHDWGAYASWALCLMRAHRVRRHITLSVGHPRAFLSAGLEQMRKSLYMLFFAVPVLSERIIAADDFRRLRDFTGGRYPDIDRAVADLSRPGRLTAGLNWYRANLLSSMARRWPHCRVPTMGIWSSDDRYLGEAQMANSARYMDGPWRYERLSGVGHWAPLEAPDAVARLAVEWLQA